MRNQRGGGEGRKLCVGRCVIGELTQRSGTNDHPKFGRGLDHEVDSIESSRL